MGLSMSRLWSLLWSKKEIRVLILGLVRRAIPLLLLLAKILHVG